MNSLYGQFFKSPFCVGTKKRFLLSITLLSCFGFIAESHGFGFDIGSEVGSKAGASGIDNQLLMKSGRSGKLPILQLDNNAANLNTIDPSLKALIDSINPEEIKPAGANGTDQDKRFEAVLQDSPYQPADFAGAKPDWVVTSGTESFICQNGQITNLRKGQFTSVDKAIDGWNKDFLKSNNNSVAFFPGIYVATDQVSVSMTSQIGFASGMADLNKCLNAYSEMNACTIGRPVQQDPGGSKGSSGGGTATENTGGSTAPCRSLVTYSSTNLGGGAAGAGGGDDPDDSRNWRKVKTPDDRYYIHPDNEDALKAALGNIDRKLELGKIGTLTLFGLGYYWPVSWIPRPVYSALKNHPGASSVCVGSLCSLAMLYWQSRSGRVGAGFYMQGAIRTLPIVGHFLCQALPENIQSPAFAGILGCITTSLMATSVKENEEGKEKMSLWRFFYSRR